jgi:hypothetical protein
MTDKALKMIDNALGYIGAALLVFCIIAVAIIGVLALVLFCIDNDPVALVFGVGGSAGVVWMLTRLMKEVR